MLPHPRPWSLPRQLLAGLPSLLPTSCALCGVDAQRAICSDCRTQFLSAPVTRCKNCGITANGTQCGTCLAHPPRFDTTIVACDYTPPLDQLVLALKFGHRLELAPLLGSMLAEAAQTLPAKERPALLVPVPLGPRRLIERGFNQAQEIGRSLARALSIPLDARLLQRPHDTGPQSLLPLNARRANVAAAFAVRKNLDGLHVGLIDDVMTTGETFNAAAATLKRHGAARVTCFVFARTLPH